MASVLGNIFSFDLYYILQFFTLLMEIHYKRKRLVMHWWSIFTGGPYYGRHRNYNCKCFERYISISKEEKHLRNTFCKSAL